MTGIVVCAALAALAWESTDSSVSHLARAGAFLFVVLWVVAGARSQA